MTEPTIPRQSVQPPRGTQDSDDIRAAYAVAVQMAVYDGQLSWQVTGLYVQFAFLLVAGAIFPSFTGSTDTVLQAVAGGLVAMAGVVTALMFGSMCMRIRTYQDYWVARAEEIESSLAAPGVLSGASDLSRTRAITAGGTTIRMNALYRVKTKVMMNVLFAVFAVVFLALLALNLVRLVQATG